MESRLDDLTRRSTAAAQYSQSACVQCYWWQMQHRGRGDINLEMAWRVLASVKANSSLCTIQPLCCVNSLKAVHVTIMTQLPTAMPLESGCLSKFLLRQKNSQAISPRHKQPLPLMAQAAKMMDGWAQKHAWQMQSSVTLTPWHAVCQACSRYHESLDFTQWRTYFLRRGSLHALKTPCSGQWQQDDRRVFQLAICQTFFKIVAHRCQSMPLSCCQGLKVTPRNMLFHAQNVVTQCLAFVRQSCKWDFHCT